MLAGCELPWPTRQDATVVALKIAWARAFAAACSSMTKIT
jgi:hypothetical protein